MPYDENGNFIYPLPTRKTKQSKSTSAARSAPPTVIPNIPKSLSVVTSQSQNEAAALNSGTGKPVAVPEIPEVAQAQAIPAPDLPLQLQTIHEGSNKWQLSEMDIALLWNSQRWPASLRLVSSDGQPIEIVYRGRWSGGFGPDFKGAIIRLGHKLLKGDIELHLRSSDWQQHGHQQNNNYNQVILQVVLEEDSFPTAEITADGRAIPALVLLPLFRLANLSLVDTVAEVKKSGTRLGSVSESAGPCCDRVAEAHPDLSELLAQLDKLGEQRFEERAVKYETACSTDSDSSSENAAQELWAGLLEALGYAQNKTPFRKLAASLPLVEIVNFEREARLRRESSEERLLNLETLLLGVAGLLPSQRQLKSQSKNASKTGKAEAEAEEDYIAARYSEDLENRWQLLQRNFTGAGQFLTEKDWVFARLRPPNHPSRRLAGLARLVLRWELSEPATLLDKLAEILDIAPSPTAYNTACQTFNELCRVELTAANSDSDLFWSRRYDFADRAILASMKAKGASADLIGTDRAADIVVNVFLPFLAAYGRDRYQPTLAKTALAAYHAHPRLSNNELIDNVARQVFNKWLGQPDATGQLYTISRLITGACRQQGLIFLHRTFCSEQNFEACPLS